MTRGSFAEKVTGVENRMLDALRSKASARVARDAPTGALDSFRRRRTCVLVTYKRDGTPVPSPVWFGVRDGKLYIHTAGWKVKRILRDPRVRVAPSTFRGRPVGSPIEGRARVLSPAERSAGEAAWRANFTPDQRLYFQTLGRLHSEMAEIVEVTPND
jgi:PPOX class probable F420-dependent enzyme